MKKSLIKSMLAVCTITSITVGSICGCAEKNENSAEKKVKDNIQVTETDIESVVSGLENHYVLQNAKDIDYMYGIEYDKDVVKDIVVDASPVKIAETGKYQIKYTVKVDVPKLQTYMEKAKEEKNENKDNTDKKASADDTSSDDSKEQTPKDNNGEKTDTVSSAVEDKNKTSVDNSTKEDSKTEKEDKSEEGKKDTENKTDDVKTASSSKDNSGKTGNSDEIKDVEIKKDVEVVDEKTGQELANKGENVWKDNNESIPKIETPVTDDNVANTNDTNAAQDNQGNASNSASQPAQTPSQPSAGNTNNSGSSNVSNSSAGNTGGNASQPAPQPTHTHTHNWVENPGSGHYVSNTETVYEDSYVCGCGSTFNSYDSWLQHSIDGCPHSYRVVPKAVGTKETGKTWVQDVKPYKYCTGCGAIQK